MGSKNANERGKRAGQKILLAKRRREVSELRLAHLTVRQIGERMGISYQTVCNDIKVIVQDDIDRMRGQAEIVRQLQLDSLDEIERIAREQYREAHRSAFQTFKVVGDDGKITERLFLTKAEGVRTGRQAAMTRLDCMRRRAKLLGLDAPTKHVVQIVEVRKLFVEFAGKIGGIAKQFIPRDMLPRFGTDLNKALSVHTGAIKTLSDDR